MWLPLELATIICTFLPSLFQFSFNHLNKHFLSFYFGNLTCKINIVNQTREIYWMNYKTTKNTYFYYKKNVLTWTLPCGSLSSNNCSWIACGKNSKRWWDWVVSCLFHSPSSSIISWARISFSSAMSCCTCRTQVINEYQFQNDKLIASILG